MAALRSVALAVLVCCTGACATTAGTATATARSETDAVAAAEKALEANDCRTASEAYLEAARASADANVSMRASQLALGCSQLGAARTATARWRELEPWSGDAALSAAIVALKRYDLPEAREALAAWRDSGSSGSQDPLQFAELLADETDVTALYRVFGEVLVGEEPSAEVLLAQARLAMSAQNMRVAVETAVHAAQVGNGMVEAQLIVFRGLSALGEHEAAIRGAMTLRGSLTGDDAFLVADLLIAADREPDAEGELTRMAAVPALAAGAARRLFAMAMRRGDVAAAEQYLAPMLGEGGNTAMAALLLAQLAERRGDNARAIQIYRLLANGPLALSARASAAQLLLRDGDRAGALALLDEYAAQGPQASLEVGTTRAHLLAEAGDVKAALAGLDALAREFPDHPDLDYQRATVLETAGRTRDAIAQFERALKKRPDDPLLQNALGFTLADHGQRLPRAEELIRASLAVSPDNPAIQDSLGWVLFRRGKTDEALPILARAYANSGDGEIAAHYGEVLWKSGDEAQALYVWQQALRGDPEHRGLRDTMKRLTGGDAG